MSKKLSLPQIIGIVQSKLNVDDEEMAHRLCVEIETFLDLKRDFLPYPQYKGPILIALKSIYRDKIFEDLSIEEYKSKRRDSLRRTIEKAIGATAIWEEVNGELQLKPINQ